jgi:hypothetical protein
MPDEPTEPTTDAPEVDAAEPAQDKASIDWEAEARKWERRSKDNLAKLREAEPKLTEYEQIVASRKTEAERLAEETTRWQTEAEKWRGNAIGNRIEALAASDFADPSDAVGQLDINNYLDAGGQIDEAAIKADLNALLERKPHWRRQEGVTAPRVPAPNTHQGSGVNGTPASNPAAEFGAILQSQISGSR